MQNTITKHISIPRVLVKKVEKKADMLGFDLPEFIRFLLAREVHNDIEFLDDELKESLKKGLEDVKSNRLSGILSTDEDIKAYITASTKQ